MLMEFLRQNANYTEAGENLKKISVTLNRRKIFRRIDSHISLSLNLRFSAYFRFPGFLLFRNPIPRSDLENFTRDIVS